MRFTVYTWGSVAFSAGTHDETHAKILTYHRARTKACQFHVDFKVNIASPGEAIPYSGAYTIVDNHEVAC